MGPRNLLNAEAFGIYKFTDVIIVSKDKNPIFETFLVVALSLKDFKNSQKFMIMDFIPSFGEDHFLKEKSY